MNPSLRMKHFFAKFFGITGALQYTLRARSRDKFPILMYHRVIPIGEVGHGQAGMFVEPATFEMHIQYLKIYFEVVPLSRMMEVINSKLIGKDRPVCILTFDDGWQDFFKFAYPILEMHKVPATVFLPTKFIGTNNKFWSDQLTELIGNRKLGDLQDEVIANIPPDPVLKKILNLKGSQEVITENAILILKEMREEKVWDILHHLKAIWDVDDKSHNGVFLQWEEVEIMAGSGLVTFGSHTDSHKILTSLQDKEIREELITSKETLIKKKVVDPSFIPFSYPNGNYDERIVHLVKDTGYHVAVTTENGWNDLETPPFHLRRIAVHQDMSSTKEMFGCRITNIF